MIRGRMEVRNQQGREDGGRGGERESWKERTEKPDGRKGYVRKIWNEDWYLERKRDDQMGRANGLYAGQEGDESGAEEPGNERETES